MITSPLFLSLLKLRYVMYLLFVCFLFFALFFFVFLFFLLLFLLFCECVCFVCVVYLRVVCFCTSVVTSLQFFVYRAAVENYLYEHNLAFH